MDSNLKKGSSIARMIWLVGSPVVFTIGVFGNIMTIIVLTHKSQKKSSTTVFLTFLAMADLVVMIVTLPRWWLIYLFGLDIRHLGNGLCKIHWFIGYTNSTLSNGILSAVTIERVLSTIIPHKTRSLCSVKIALVISGIILVVYLFFFLHVLIEFSLFDVKLSLHNNLTENLYASFNANLFNNFTDSFGQGTDVTGLALNNTENDWDMKETNGTITKTIKMCWFQDKNYQAFYSGPFQVLNNLTYFAIPEIIFFIGGIIIVRKLRASRSRIAPTQTGAQQKMSGRENHQRQITISLLLVNLVFVVCTTPVLIFMTGRSAWVDSKKGMTATQEIVWAVINMMFFTNHAVNFILYFLSGARFRKQVIAMFPFLCSKLQSSGREQSQNHVTAGTQSTVNANATVDLSGEDVVENTEEFNQNRQ